jgi:hypothetical protein
MKSPDNRSLVRSILRDDPCKKSLKKDKSKVFREALKRSITPDQYWSPKPSGFKGNKLQWSNYQN